MITWCWLVEHACIKLVSRLKRILKEFWKGTQKRIASEFNLKLKTPLFQLNVKENQHATKRSLLVEKQKDFSDQKCIDSQPKKFWVGTAGVARSIEWQNFMAAKLKVNFFASLRVALLVLQVNLPA